MIQGIVKSVQNTYLECIISDLTLYFPDLLSVTYLLVCLFVWTGATLPPKLPPTVLRRLYGARHWNWGPVLARHNPHPFELPLWPNSICLKMFLPHFVRPRRLKICILFTFHHFLIWYFGLFWRQSIISNFQIFSISSVWRLSFPRFLLQKYWGSDYYSILS